MNSRRARLAASMGILGVIAAVASIVTGSASSLTVSPEKLTVRSSTAASIPAGTPGLSLSASPNPVTVGSATTATATLGSPAGAEPYGDVTFSRYASADCTGAAIETSAPIALTGAPASASTSHTPSAAGTFSWSATYGGNADNDPAGPTCVAVTVSATTTPTATKLRLSSITIVGGARDGNSQNWQAQLSVKVVDENGAAVSGVTVSGSWTSPNVSQNGCTPTAADGTCTFLGNFNGNGNNGSPRTWTVGGLSKSGYTYDSANNTVNTITCSRSTGNGDDTTCSAATL